MRRLRWAKCLTPILIACLFVRIEPAAHGDSTTASPAAVQTTLPEPMFWRQLAFSIPFKVTPVAAADQQPVQIRLYVSTNQGNRWDVAQSVSPQERSFMFRATGDGEYWFLIRTVDRQGRISPDVSGPPEMRVIVDTVPPRLDLSAVRGDAGEIRATWQAFDPLLNADSLKIEYQTAAGQWRPVAMDRPKSGGDRSNTSGTLTWWPTDAPESNVAVRAEISDRAGNVTVSQAKAAGNSVTPSNTAPSTAVRPKVDRSIPPPLVDSTAQSDIKSNPSQWSAASTRGGTAWPTYQSTDVPLGRNTNPADGSFAVSPKPPDAPYIASRNDAVGRAGPPAGDIIRTPIADPFRLPPDKPPNFAAAGPVGSTVENVNPPIRNQMSSGLDNRAAAPAINTPPATPPASVGNPLLPPNQRPRMVNSRSFEMDYEIDSIGPSGVAKVELWGTRDGGRTWSSYGIDPDNRSPIRVNVDGEGLYGFRIVVQSGSGLGGLPPRSGDQPELWVVVDLTKPAVRLIDAIPGSGPQGGEVLIRWEATDAALATRPITLQFSDKPGGPWSTIAAGLENNGQYTWRPDNQVPERVYLRVEARDEAGNVGAFEATQPVTLERIRPEGKIRGVRSIDTAEGGRVYEMTYR